MERNTEAPAASPSTYEPAAVLEFLDTRFGEATACSFLTPAIKARMSALEPGQVLLVRVDDPSALLDVPAWCALTGHVLAATAHEENGVLDFFIRKVSRR